ncbi:MAG: cytochrome c biogenesis protein CcsA [Oligoflexales bacterium]|nr:cytochrome c biogenesis protein CcsA [Oligoflexales bacterium]
MTHLFSLNLISLILYALATMAYLASFTMTAAQEQMKKNIGLASYILATVFASLVLFFTIQDALHRPTLLFLACCVAWLALIGYWRFRIDIIGSLTSPVLVVLLLLELFSKKTQLNDVTATYSLLAFVHISLSIIGQAFAIVASALALRYLWLQRILKNKILNQLKEGDPSLGKLDRHLHLSLWVGFIFITFGLVTGAAFLHLLALDSIDINLISKTIWALIVWCWYLIILLARNTFGLPTRRVAELSVLGFFLLAIAFFGIFFVIDFASWGAL